jgi:uncharacterized membrane protein
MMALAGLVYLPSPLVGAFGALLIAGHNLFDEVTPEELGPFSPLWTFLHVRTSDAAFGVPFYVSYPLIPWAGVMAVGYALGPVLREERPARRRKLLLLGAALTAAFVVLRGGLGPHGYGDPRPWDARQYEGFPKVLGFLGTEKYPPSLQYLLMTLGPILMSLACLEGARGAVARWLMTFGRAPLFFYVAHLFVIHGLAVALGAVLGHDPGSLCVAYDRLPSGWGFPLPVVYLVWVFVMVVLTPPCAWFSELKRRNRSVWLSYL